MLNDLLVELEHTNLDILCSLEYIVLKMEYFKSNLNALQSDHLGFGMDFSCPNSWRVKTLERKSEITNPVMFPVVFHL